MKELENQFKGQEVEIDEEKALENVQKLINHQRRRKETAAGHPKPLRPPNNPLLRSGQALGGRYH